MRYVTLASIVMGWALITTSGASAQTAAATTKTTTVRHYDCTKAGNANKAACKSAAPAAAPAGAPKPASASAPAAPAPAARTVSTHTVQHSTTTQTTSAAGPTGATAICNDGTYSHSAHHSGSCSRHKGVKQFY